MKATKAFVLVLIILAVVYMPVCANQDENQEILQEQYQATGADELMDQLPDGVDEQLEENGIESPSSEEIMEFDIGSFFHSLWNSAVSALKSPLVLLASSIGIILLCAMFEAFRDTIDNSLSGVLNVVTSLAISSVLLIPVIHCITYIANIIQETANFLMCFIPVFSGIIGASGCPTAALGYNTALFAVVQLISAITSHLLLPFIGVFLALSVCCSVSGQFDISSLTSTVRKTVMWSLTLMITLFVGLFSAQNMVASSADTLSIKTAKFMSGSFVPIIGNAIGDAIGSVVGCLGLIKSSVGAFGIIVCILTFLPPILLVLFYMLAIKLSGACADILGVKGISLLLNAVFDTLSILIAFLICYAVLTIVTTTMMIAISSL